VYDEPEICPRERLKPSEIEARGRTKAFVRALAAAVPAVGFWLWISALLGVGPLVGNEWLGLLVWLVALVAWIASFGRNVIPR
jgi:hypothetical protein